MGNSGTKAAYREDGSRYMNKEQLLDATTDWALEGDRKAEEELVRHHWRLAMWYGNAFAKRYRASAEEAQSIALLGLVMGIRRYSEAAFMRAMPIRVFISNTIRWQLKRELPQVRYRISFPSEGSKAGRVLRALPRAMDELGLGHPLLSDGIARLAEYLGTTVKTVENVYLAMQTRDTTQETPLRAVTMGLDPSVIETLEDNWPMPDEVAHSVLLRQRISRWLMHSLNPREERVVRMRFGIGCREHTLEEVGAQLGTARERPRQIEAKALRKMKQHWRLVKMFGRTAYHAYDRSRCLSDLVGGDPHLVEG